VVRKRLQFEPWIKNIVLHWCSMQIREIHEWQKRDWVTEWGRISQVMCGLRIQNHAP
jgi:hypothetical protein